MKLKIFYALLLVTCLISGAEAQQKAKMTPGGIGYLEYLPQGYSTNTNKYPIVISLHGIKEKGNTLSSLSVVDNVGLPKYVAGGKQFPFILISPQLKTTMSRWTGDYVMKVINHVKSYLRVDASRIYLTGLSLGGGGVWSVASAYPNVFAAIVPVCSGYNVLSGSAAIAGSDIPVWAFHGDADAVVSEYVTINAVNSVNKYKPSPLAKVTIFPGMSHLIWDKVYLQTTALNWMLTFRNGTTTTSTESQTPAPTTTTTTNVAPIANSGANKYITLPTNYITITGSGKDSDGTIASYTWSKVRGGTVTMSGTTTTSLKLTNLVAGSYVFRLTVKDNKGAIDTDDMLLVVYSSTVAELRKEGSDKSILINLENLSTDLASANLSSSNGLNTVASL